MKKIKLTIAILMMLVMIASVSALTTHDVDITGGSEIDYYLAYDLDDDTKFDGNSADVYFNVTATEELDSANVTVLYYADEMGDPTTNFDYFDGSSWNTIQVVTDKATKTAYSFPIPTNGLNVGGTGIVQMRSDAILVMRADFYEIAMDYVVVSSNTEPTIDSITDENSVEYLHLGNYDVLGDTITLTTIVTDLEGDASLYLSVEDDQLNSWFQGYSGNEEVTLTVGDTIGDYETYSISYIIEDADYSNQVYFTLNFIEQNEEPILNSISPDSRVELTNGDYQTFTSDVTDTDNDAIYNWTLGGIVVSTTDSYTANWDDIAPGIYTLQLEVSDAEYLDTESMTLEIRAKGGSASSGSFNTLETQDEEVEVDVEDDKVYDIVPKQQTTLDRISLSVGNFFKSLMFWK